ncbi:sigma-54 dependent transcriptional regulator [Telmatospirillum sp. J64-1]|uniref:sigma-54-dependent transcriptional regulator n=1 Tax=Telmatospirillum sp. J64-1 TaxID=2502183 RepID=UPI002106270C|nr:sigma-54 dependent transcriptional regulator [Telmatospirillum sp. J64-1]
MVDILVIDDEEDVLAATAQTLELEGWTVVTAASASGIAAELSPNWPGVVVTDVRMPAMDGFGLLQAITAIDPDIPVILITGHGDIRMAMAAVRAGAFDFIEKPADPDFLVDVVRRALSHRSLVLENRRLRKCLVDGSTLAGRLIGHTPVMERLRASLQQLAQADVDVLLFGETGTGKELAARCLHEFGPRSMGNFVAINCGALPESIVESELFGHEPGAFTGAQSRRIGKIEHANGGTLFLDEIESMPMHLQIRLLRVLQERSVERLGGNTSIPLDLRVIAATKTNLKTLSDEGRFRADLYYRLNVVMVTLPPLRDRRSDIPLLLRHFLDLARARRGQGEMTMDAAVLARLQAQDWPGNVRELRNTAERLALGLNLDEENMSAEEGRGARSLAELVEAFERQVILAALNQHGWRIGVTAEALGLLRKTLYLKMRRYGLQRADGVIEGTSLDEDVPESSRTV